MNIPKHIEEKITDEAMNVASKAVIGYPANDAEFSDWKEKAPHSDYTKWCHIGQYVIHGGQFGYSLADVEGFTIWKDAGYRSWNGKLYCTKEDYMTSHNPKLYTVSELYQLFLDHKNKEK